MQTQAIPIDSPPGTAPLPTRYMHVFDLGGIKVGIINPSANTSSFHVYSEPLNERGVRLLRGFFHDRLPKGCRIQEERASRLSTILTDSAKHPEGWIPVFAVSVEVGHDTGVMGEEIKKIFSKIEAERAAPDFTSHKSVPTAAR